MSIYEHRRRIRRSLAHSPSLNDYIQKVFDECYEDARQEAAIETGLSLNTFPLRSPFTQEQVLDANFLPDFLPD